MNMCVRVAQSGWSLFPDLALIHDPVQWRAIRLRSSPIPFHVTGEEHLHFHGNAVSPYISVSARLLRSLVLFVSSSLWSVLPAGVVHHMSAPLAKLHIPILNVSTFHHNYSIVETDNTHASAEALQSVTSAKVHKTEAAAEATWSQRLVVEAHGTIV